MLSIKKDPVLKDYFLVKERVADLFNAAFYDGQNVILASSLLDADSESSTLFDMAPNEVLAINRTRDSFLSAVFVMIGIENQSYIDYHMPLKNFLYDAVSYNKQYRTYQNKKKENEEMKLHLLPVITLTFYYGERRWTGPRSLLDMMKVPEEYRNEGMNDWNANIIDIKDINPLTLHNQDNRSLVEGVQRLYKWNGDIEKLKDMVVSREVGIVIASITGKQELVKAIEEEKGEMINMCSSIEKFVSERETKSKLEGNKQGRISTLTKLLTQKLGILPKELTIQIERSNEEQLDELTIHMFDIENQEDILQILSH